jgi:hypothetical protein
MRIPSRCSCGGRALTYATVQSERYTTRYRRCDSCGETLKSIQIRSLSSNKSIDVATVDADNSVVIHKGDY